jgi:hypothetical protein
MISEKSPTKSDMRENFQSILIIRSWVETKMYMFFLAPHCINHYQKHFVEKYQSLYNYAN